MSNIYIEQGIVDDCHNDMNITMTLRDYIHEAIKVTRNYQDQGAMAFNSGKTRMGRFTPYFEITNNQTGKVREVGTESVKRAIERETRFGKNRRNDPERNWGLSKNS